MDNNINVLITDIAINISSMSANEENRRRSERYREKERVTF